MKKALSFDIGGTKIYYAIIDETGKIDFYICLGMWITSLNLVCINYVNGLWIEFHI